MIIIFVRRATDVLTAVVLETICLIVTHFLFGTKRHHGIGLPIVRDNTQRGVVRSDGLPVVHEKVSLFPSAFESPLKRSVFELLHQMFLDTPASAVKQSSVVLVSALCLRVPHLKFHVKRTRLLADHSLEITSFCSVYLTRL